MAQNTRRFACTPGAVFDVLADGWLYPVWVVGASRMRQVDDDWPRTGTKLYHSFGTWPVLIDDSTSVEEWDPPRRMVLTARGWPMGEARVRLDVTPDGEGCIVRIREDAVSGPASWLRAAVDPLIRWRNTETLRRLAFVAEGRSLPDTARAAASGTEDRT